MKGIVVGDLHGCWGALNALISEKTPDFILACGDFGWWPLLDGKPEERTRVSSSVERISSTHWKLHGIKTHGTRVYWCDGNHEDHSVLPQDGCIHEVYKNVFFCSRGSSIMLPDGRKVVFAGGAHSIDKDQRIVGHDWFFEETIKYNDLDRILSNERADIVVSHTCPASFLPYMVRGVFAKGVDPSCQALEAVLDHLHPDLWFFGHWHLHKEGYTKGCRWTCLDYPKNTGRWWKYIP